MSELSRLDASVLAPQISEILTTQVPAVPRFSIDIKPANNDDAPRESPHDPSTDRYSNRQRFAEVLQTEYERYNGRLVELSYIW
jgi:hypothetical protein